MPSWWLLHAVGNADLGVSPADDLEHVIRRLATLASTNDTRTLAALLRDLAWAGPVSGVMSPLGFAAGSVPGGDPARLVLVATPTSRVIADAIVDVLRRAPDAVGRRFDNVSIVETAGADAAGLSEHELVAELTPVLAAADAQRDQALITWGSGSTQLTLGMLDAVVCAAMPWRLANVSPNLPSARYQIFRPVDGLTIDPTIPLLRRWRFHDMLATVAAPGTDLELWRRAYLRPDAEGLRVVVADALARGDATSGFALRSYIWTRYQELRTQDRSAPLDLQQWAITTWNSTHAGDTWEPLNGHLLRFVREPRWPSDVGTAKELRRSRDSSSGRWLRSDEVRALDDAGQRSSHALAPPPAKFLRTLRHQTGIVAAVSAWYIAVLGTSPSAEHRNGLLLGVAADGADGVVRDYLGMPERTDVDLRFLVLGTASGSAGYAAELAGQLGAATTDTIPDPDSETPFDQAAAYDLLSRQLRPIADEVGAIVLVPSGPKSAILQLIMAGHRLAAEHGVPFYLRQLVGDGEMHRLPVRFGADRDLLDMARHALSTMELDVAARLLDASRCADLAQRIRQLTTALYCRTVDGRRWPNELPRSWSLSNRTVGLIAERLETWADLAEAHTPSRPTKPAHCSAPAR